MRKGSQGETHGQKPPYGYYNGAVMAQSASRTYPCSQTESAEETGVLTPKRLHFLLIIIIGRAAGEGGRANSMG